MCVSPVGLNIPEGPRGPMSGRQHRCPHFRSDPGQDRVCVLSRISQLVNLRFKGNGIFWLEDHAEGLLHLRAHLLAGRWSTFVRTILQDETFWLIAQEEAA